MIWTQNGNLERRITQLARATYRDVSVKLLVVVVKKPEPGM
jgi:hypothetical protein